MAFCKYCGKSLNDGVKFCPSCGAAMEDASGAGNTANVISPAAQTGEYDAADIEKTKVICAISYISILFFLPLVAYPDSKYGRFHANQALVLLIATVIWSTALSVVIGVFSALPLMPDFMKNIVSTILGAAEGALPLAGMIFGIVNALNGKAAQLPIIGGFNLINK